MNIQPLIDAGLTEAQAYAYTSLLECSPITPPDLSEIISETRSNTYKVLEQLEEMGLARREDIDKKIHYWALSPSALVDLLETEETEVERRRSRLEANLPALREAYLEHNRQPGVRQFRGRRGLEQILEMQLTDSEQIHFIRSNADHLDPNYPTVRKYRHYAREKNIHRYGVTQDIAKAPKNWQESDPFMQLTRTWIEENDYDSPVEWAVFGDKVSILNYGDDPVGLVIENREIAAAFLKLWDMIDTGARRESNYAQRPLNAQGQASTEDDVHPY